jgi:hypothetical protein
VVQTTCNKTGSNHNDSVITLVLLSHLLCYDIGNIVSCSVGSGFSQEVSGGEAEVAGTRAGSQDRVPPRHEPSLCWQGILCCVCVEGGRWGCECVCVVFVCLGVCVQCVYREVCVCRCVCVFVCVCAFSGCVQWVFVCLVYMCVLASVLC